MTEHQYYTQKEVRRNILKEYYRLKNWRKVAAHFASTPGLCWRIAVENFEPSKPKTRAKFNYVALAPTPVCPVHGVVHARKTCPPVRTYKDLYDYPPDTLLALLQARIPCPEDGHAP